MARSTRLMILIKNIYTIWGRKRFLLPVLSDESFRISKLILSKSYQRNDEIIIFQKRCCVDFDRIFFSGILGQLAY